MINQNLVRSYETWLANGSPGQAGFDWTSTKEKWLSYFQADTDFIWSIPQLVDRTFLRKIVSGEEYSIRHKFLAVMIWGYGDRAYGPYRVDQMLRQINTEYLLNQAFNLAQSGKPIEAYGYLSKNRINFLGPSYTSKFVCFSTPREIGAPIFDSFIARWLEKNTSTEFKDLSLSSQTWNIKAYTKYLTWIQAHAKHLNAYPDDLELVIFREAEGMFSKNSRWIKK